MCCTQQDPISCPNPISCTLLVIDSIALVNNMSGAALAKLSLLLSVFISSKSEEQDEKISNVIKNNLINNNFYSSLNPHLYSLSKIISSKIYFKNQTTNSEIINKIKNLNLNFVNRTDLLSIFFPNLSISNVYIESIFENNNTILSISNQTKTSGFSSKIYIWDATSSTYLENNDLNTNLGILTSIEFMIVLKITEREPENLVYGALNNLVIQSYGK